MTLSKAKYDVCCNQVAQLLSDCRLIADRIAKPRYPADLPAIMRGLNYRERWERCKDEGWYDYALEDGSLFQFRHADDNFSFSYLECPFEITPFEEFAFDRMGDGWELVEGDLRQEYELFQSSEIAEQSVTPVRYDYEPRLYRQGVHPAGHIHIGVDSNLRIAAKKVLNPLSFVMFVVRQHYPASWEKFVLVDGFDIRAREVRENLDDVSNALFQGLDHKEMYFA